MKGMPFRSWTMLLLTLVNYGVVWIGCRLRHVACQSLQISAPEKALDTVNHSAGSLLIIIHIP